MSYLELDGKPEKGERKVADDMILLINDILVPFGNKDIDQTVLYRLGMMEYSMEQSPYNFDIQLALLQLYDKRGLSISFNEALQNLGLKGVQLESMGYLLFRHVLDWCEFNQFKSFFQKFSKYFKLNQKDLRSLKAHVLKENNFDQMENFIDYESHVMNSYFNTLVRFANYQIELIDNLQQPDYIKGFFSNMTQSLVKDNQLITDFASRDKKERTQDLKIVASSFEDIPQYKEFAKPEESWLREFEDDDYLHQITKNDKIYAYYKFDRKSNFKSNLRNSLGVFEHPETFALVQSLLTTVAQTHLKLVAKERSQIKEDVD